MSRSPWHTQVRCGTGSKRRFLLEPQHQIVRHFPRRSPRAIRHTNKRRLTGFQLRDALKQLARPVRRLRRKELEGKGRAVPRKDVVDVHGGREEERQAVGRMNGFPVSEGKLQTSRPSTKNPKFNATSEEPAISSFPIHCELNSAPEPPPSFRFFLAIRAAVVSPLRTRRACLKAPKTHRCHTIRSGISTNEDQWRYIANSA